MVTAEKVIVKTENPILVTSAPDTDILVVKAQSAHDCTYLTFKMSRVDLVKCSEHLTSILTDVRPDNVNLDSLELVKYEDMVFISDDFYPINMFALVFPNEIHTSNSRGETIRLDFGLDAQSLSELKEEGYEILKVEENELEHFKTLNKLYSGIVGIESLGTLTERAEEAVKSLEHQANMIDKVANELEASLTGKGTEIQKTHNSDLEVLKSINRVKKHYGGNLKTTVYYCVDFFDTVFFSINGVKEFYEVSAETFVEWAVTNIGKYHLVDTGSMELFAENANLDSEEKEKVNLEMPTHLDWAGSEGCKGGILAPHKAIIMDSHLKYTIDNINLYNFFIDFVSDNVKNMSNLTELIGGYEVYTLGKDGSISNKETYDKVSMVEAIDGLNKRLETIDDFNSLGVLEVKSTEKSILSMRTYTKQKVRIEHG